MVRELSFRCYGLRVQILDTVDADICGGLTPLLPPPCEPSNIRERDLCYTVRSTVPGAAPDQNGYEVLRDGHAVFQGPAPGEIIRWLRVDVERQVAEGSPVGMFVHAGVVSWRGRGILIPGRSLTGKSSLVAAFVQRGATYYSDEFAVLDEEGRVHPYARALFLRAGQGPARPVTVDELGGVAGRDPAPVSLIVSTSYKAGIPWNPEVLRGTRAVLPLIDNTVLAREEPRRTARLAASLAHGVVTLRGPRPDATEVAPKILDFFDQVLDDRSVDPVRVRYAHVSHRLGSAYYPPLEGSSAPTGGVDGDGPPEPVWPAHHLRIENFLEPAEHRRVLQYALAHESAFQASGVVNRDGTLRVDPEVRRSRSLRDLDEVWGLFEPRLLSLLPRARREFNLPWFPIGRIERQLAVYQDGAFFVAHTDNARNAEAKRWLTCVYNFHAAPKRFSGGVLRLYDGVVKDGCLEPASTYTDLEPVDNSLVLFPSGLYHEVQPVRCETAEFQASRFALIALFSTASPAE